MTKKIFKEIIRRDVVYKRMNFAATAETEELFNKLGTGPDGVYDAFVVDYRDTYGENNVSYGKKISLSGRLAKAFIDPFNSFLLMLVVILFFTNIIFAEPGDADPMAVIIISTIVLISGLLRFVQETRSGCAAENLHKMMMQPVNVQRQRTGKKEIPLGEVVVGDIVHLSAGDMIPADIRIIKAVDLSICQSALTGESAAVEKIANEKPAKTIFDKGGNSLSFWRWRWNLHQNCFQ